MKPRLTHLIMTMILASAHLMAQQEADTSYNPEIREPAFETGRGPVVYIDEGHYNFHTKDGRYQAFAKLLTRDGYRIEGYCGEFTGEHPFLPVQPIP